jgi:hypothetical protein
MPVAHYGHDRNVPQHSLTEMGETPKWFRLNQNEQN